MSVLQILCPNGRRQNVKTTPNTKLLQVLEDVCQKQKFLPAEDYKLIHGRNTLDLTLSVRYANLANNAKLELVKAEKSRAESEVVIALQLVTGERLQASFQPATTLWDLLLHWENQPNSAHKDALTRIDTSQTPGIHPVCIYLREEIIGELALKETKLRSLGLTGGKAAIRLAHRPVEDTTLQEIANKIEKEKEKQARTRLSGAGVNRQSSVNQSTSEASVQTPPTDTKSTDQSHSECPSATHITENTSISLNINVNIQGESKPDNYKGQDNDEPKPKVGRVEKADNNPEPMEVESSDSTEAAMETEDVQKVTADSTSSVEDNAEVRRQAQREVAENLRAMNLPGVEIFTPDDFKELTPEEQAVAKKLAEAIMPRLGLRAAATSQQGAQNQVAVPKKKKQPAVPFAEFKFPEETKGKKLYKNELSEMTKEDFKPCDRQTLVYSLEESIMPESASSNTDLPEDFFELTEDDIKKLIVAQKKQLDSLENQPLMTSAMRQARLEAAYSKYDKVVIRVQFHDKLVLQGVFRPQETVFALQKFVKDYLEDKSIPFYLYTSPPKTVFKDVSQTLLEARLVPASVVYFGCENHQEHYLSEALLSEIRPRIQAEQIIAECLGISKYEEPGPIPKQQPGSSKGKQPASQRYSSSDSLPSTSAQPSTSSQGQSKPVPKWFKMGKK